MLKDNGYGGTQLSQHAAACASKMARPMETSTPDAGLDDGAASDAAWLLEPSIPFTYLYSDGSSKTHLFEKHIEDGKRGQICCIKGCGVAFIAVPGHHHAKQHVKKYHDKPDESAQHARTQARTLGSRGASLMKDFFGKAKAKGIADLDEKKSAVSDVSSASSSISTAAASSYSPVLPPIITGPRQTDRLQQLQSLLDDNAELRRQLLRNRGSSMESTEATPEARQVVCRGKELKVPDPIHANYPYDLESLVAISWRRPDENGVIRSFECSGWSNEDPCSSCRDLDKVVELQKLQARANDPNIYLTRINDAYLTQSQQKQRQEHHRKIESMLRLELSKATSKLNTSMHIATDMDRMLIAIKTGNTKRLSVIAARLMKRNAKPSTIVSMFEKAAQGLVPSARGKGYEEIEIEKGVALLILGGPRAVRVDQLASGGASASAVKNSDLYRSPRFYASSGPQNFDTLEHNIAVLIATLPPPTAPCAWHLAYDNVNVEERLRYDFSGGEAFGGLRGVARESAVDESLIIKSYADVLRLKRAIERGSILLSKEITMLVAIRNSTDPIVVPLFASGTAKVKGISGFDAQRDMVLAALALWEQRVAPVFGEIISVASDHDSTNGRTMSFLKHPMSEGPRHDLCKKMVLFDKYEGPFGVSVKFDEQHNGKNHRAKIVRKSGFVVHLIHFTRESLIDLLHSVTGVQIAELEKYFPPPTVDDHQNVGSMVKGFMAVARLRGVTIDRAVLPYPEAKKPKYVQLLLEAQPLAEVANCWHFMFTKHDASLPDHVLNMATLAGLLFVIRKHSKQFIPSQLYTAVITSIECVMNDIITCQQKNYKHYYLWVASTHLLELLFGVFRTMLGALRNFDALQFEERASHACTLRSIFAKHPEWDQGSKRLKESFDHWNTKSWTGSVDVERVNVVDTWNLGINRAVELLTPLSFYSKEELDVHGIIKEKPETTLLNPTGSTGSMPTEEDDDERGEGEGSGDAGAACSPAVDAATVDAADSTIGGAPLHGPVTAQGESPLSGPSSPTAGPSSPSAEFISEDEGTPDEADALSESIVELEEAFAREPLDVEPERDEPACVKKSSSIVQVSLPTYILDHPDRQGEKTYVASIVSALSKSIGERTKTIARVGPGGGRVAHAAAHGAIMAVDELPVQPVNEAEGGDVEKVYPDDHACTILLIDGRPTAIVGEIVSVQAPLGLNANNSGLSAEELGDPRSKVTVRPLKSRSSAEGVLVFNGESSGPQFEVPGPFIRPLVLSIMHDGSVTSLKIDTETMKHIADASWLTIMQPPATLPALLKKAPSSLLVRDADGNPLFQVGEAEAATTERLIAHKCAIPTCKEVLIDPNSAVNHSSYHSLFTPALLPNPEPCPLCLGPSERCDVALVKTGSNQLQPRIMCQVFSPGANPADTDTWVRFTGAGMAKCTHNMPSTNTPIICPGCHPNLADPDHLSTATPPATKGKAKAPANRKAVMKYNMLTHWSRLHSSSQMPAGLVQALALAPNERTLIGANRGFKVTAAQASKLSLL